MMELLRLLILLSVSVSFCFGELGIGSCPVRCQCRVDRYQYNCYGYDSIPQNLPADAISLHFKNMSFSVLLNSSFARYSNVSEIGVFNSDIQIIEPNAFVGLSNLRRLSLYDNQLADLHPDVFEDTPNLEYLDLGSNRFNKYPSKSFAWLKSLKILYLSGNRLSGNLPPGFKYMANTLEFLDLSENSYAGVGERFFEPLNGSSLKTLIFKDMDDAFFHEGALAPLTSLKQLSLARLTVYQKCPSYVSSIFSSMPDTVQSLDLTIWQTERKMNDSCRYSPEVFSHLYKPNRNIMELYFNFSDLIFGEVLKVGLFNNTPKLQILFLIGCRITQFEEGALDGLEHLWKLDIRENPIFNRDPWYFSNIRSVKFLQLDGTNMGKGFFVNPEFTLTYWYETSFPCLEILDVNYNFFYSLPFEFDNKSFYSDPYESLRTLSISNNRIKTVDYRVFDLFPNLEHFNLRGNNIEQLLSAHNKSVPVSLLSLDMSQNELGNTSLVLQHSHFRSFTKLQRLDLGTNKIAMIAENSFQDLKQVEFMFLDDNVIVEIPPNLFRTLTSLTMLNLSKNSIRSVGPEHFSSLIALEVLCLSDNELSHFDAQTMAVFSSIALVHLERSPFACTCELMGCLGEMRRNTSRYSNIRSYMCHSPSSLDGVPLLMYDPTYFECTVIGPLRVGLGMLLACILTIGISIITYRKWWFISQFRLVIKALLKGEREVELIPRYLYDCYVLYNTAFTGPDRDWVESTLLPNIGYKEWMTDSGDEDTESEADIGAPSQIECGGPHNDVEGREEESLKIFDEARHIIDPRANILDASLVAARNSRKFIIVASKSSVEKGWDIKHQQTIAWTKLLHEHGPDRVMLIQRPDLTNQQLMESSLKCFLVGYVIEMVRYQGDEDQVWEKIKYFLRRPKSSKLSFY